MPPNLATYNKAAQQIYAPEQAAEARTLATNEKTAINTMESQKGQVQTDYQAAINNLNSTLNSNIAKINQLYTERLGGNFSGLQGNDIGGAVSTALKQQGLIESTRANKLSAIGTSETNAKLTYNTDIGNLGSKYKSLETQYAQSAYSKAVTEYQTNQYRQEELQLRAQSEADTNAYRNAELGLSSARLNMEASKSANNVSGKYKVKQFVGGNKAYTGPNGQTNLYQYAAGSSGGDPKSTYQTILHELKTGSNTDKGAYNKVAKMSMKAGIKYLQQHNSYIFD